MLQRLSPTERAAYVLRHAFDYPYPQIAAMLRLTETNVSQLVSRAGNHIAAGPRHPASRGEQECLMHAFVAAARHGEDAALERLLATVTNGRPVLRHPGIAQDTVAKPRSLVRSSPAGHPPRRRGR